MKEGKEEGPTGRCGKSWAKARYVWKRWGAGGACRKISVGYNVKDAFPNVRRKPSPV